MSDSNTSKTIEILSSIVQKVPLNKKLLSKPPFRYLHDLFSEIIRNTGAFQDLYSNDEMASENYKDKESKVGYLTKMISVIQLSTNSDLKTNPLKIVAGLDPNDTNLMLQAIGMIVLQKIDTANAVSAVTGKSKPVSEVAPVPPEEKKETISQLVAQEEVVANPATEQKIPEPGPAIQTAAPEKPKPKTVSGKQTPTDRTKPPKSAEILKPEKAAVASVLALEANEGIQQEEQSPLPAHPKGRGRPMSARPPPPKIKNTVAVEDDTSSVVPIHIASHSKDDDDFLVKAVNDDHKPQLQNEAALSLDEKHGGLVTKILQTKNDLEGSKNSKPVEKKEISANVGAKDITMLRESIQMLCQSTNPLGKTMDYLQEDADAMNNELSRWKKESAEYELKVQEQEKITKETIAPLEDRLSKIERSIQEQLQRISQLKGEILINDQNTEKQLKSIASAN